MRLALLAFLALAPLAGAVPVSSDEEVFRGVANAGDRDHASEWEDKKAGGWVCLPMMMRHRYTLTVHSTRPLDVVELRAAGEGLVTSAYALPGIPAVVEARQLDSCPEFEVIPGPWTRGAPYEVRMERVH